MRTERNEEQIRARHDVITIGLLLVLMALMSCELSAAPRPRISTPAPVPTDLQVGCWIWASHEAQLDLGIAKILELANERPNIVGPVAYQHAVVAMATKPIYGYLLRERWCGPVRAVEINLTGDEVRAYRTSIEFTLMISRRLEEGGYLP